MYLGRLVLGGFSLSAPPYLTNYQVLAFPTTLISFSFVFIISHLDLWLTFLPTSNLTTCLTMEWLFYGADLSAHEPLGPRALRTKSSLLCSASHPVLPRLDASRYYHCLWLVVLLQCFSFARNCLCSFSWQTHSLWVHLSWELILRF